MSNLKSENHDLLFKLCYESFVQIIIHLKKYSSMFEVKNEIEYCMNNINYIVLQYCNKYSNSRILSKFMDDVK
jgi:hypothetical protein